MRTVTEVYDVNNQLIEKRVVESDEGQHSVELSQDAKGMIKASVKVYSQDVTEAKDKAVKCLNELETELKGRMVGTN